MLAIFARCAVLVLAISEKRMTKQSRMLRRQQRRILSLRRIMYQRHGRGPTPPLVHIDGDILQFGVFTGGGLRAWVEAMPLLNFNFSGVLWGFDSFKGMPYENASLKLRHHKRDKSWAQGGLNAGATLGIQDWASLRDTLIRNIGYPRTRLVRGFFNETLQGGARRARDLGVRPAFLIDIDCDLYSSTRQALTFALEAHLLLPGTYVYYDDLSEHDRSQADSISPVSTTTAASQTTSKQAHREWQRRVRSLNEENIAHDDVSTEWGLKWRALPRVVKYPGPITALSWIDQLPEADKGKWVPPEQYPAVRELLSCARCAKLDIQQQRGAT